jgi:Protein of unknown function (DUF3592)
VIAAGGLAGALLLMIAGRSWREMSVLIGLWFAFAGGVAALAALTARGRVRRLRRSGQTAWAMVVPSPAAAGESGARPQRRKLIQYPLEDGRVIERLCPQPLRRAAAPAAGQKVLVWYDPADPTDVLVNGWDGRFSDLAFLVAGVFFIVVGMAVAFGH